MEIWELKTFFKITYLLKEIRLILKLIQHVLTKILSFTAHKII